jgi:glutathione S-transferase
MSDRPQLTLYGREGCHLCEEARVDLLRLRAEGLPFELAEVDIEADQDLHRYLLERIPVVEIEGERVCELLVDLDAVRARLATFGA